MGNGSILVYLQNNLAFLPMLRSVTCPATAVFRPKVVLATVPRTRDCSGCPDHQNSVLLSLTSYYHSSTVGVRCAVNFLLRTLNLRWTLWQSRVMLSVLLGSSFFVSFKRFNNSINTLGQQRHLQGDYEHGVAPRLFVSTSEMADAKAQDVYGVYSPEIPSRGYC